MARIRHVAFFTEDADKMANFYVEVFGMKITQETEPSAESGRAIFITDGYIDMAIIEPFNPKAPKGINHFGFTVEPDEHKVIMQKLRDRGIFPVTPPADRPYIEDAVKDVDGNKFDISTTGLRPKAGAAKPEAVGAP